MAVRAAILATLLPVALAFSDTHPVIAWSSHSSNALSSGSNNGETVLEDLMLHEDICHHDAVVLIDHMGLHASDLRSLPASSFLAETLSTAPSTIQLPYARHNVGNPLSDVASAISRRCGSRVVAYTSGQVGHKVGEAAGEKHVVCVSMPGLEGSSDFRKDLMAEHASQLASDLDKISSAFPSHLVIYTGWNPSIITRQSSEIEHTSFAPSNSTLPEGGILKRYQLLTPGLILSLLIACFILVPAVLAGISALASIQSPLRMEAAKGFSAQEKKNQ